MLGTASDERLQLAAMVKYFTREEIATHCSVDDCWVSVFDRVYDLSPLLQEDRGALALPIIEAAGSSISHWFNEKTGTYKTFMDPKRNIEMPYTPQGRFLHVPPPQPSDTDVVTADLPWWKDPRYIIGCLTKKTRPVRIVNMLTQCEDVVNACSEETINDIRDRYLQYNAHAKSYTWKALVHNDFAALTMTQTLEENGIPDESEKFFNLGMDDDFNVPSLHIYYNDDLTIA